MFGLLFGWLPAMSCDGGLAGTNWTQDLIGVEKDSAELREEIEGQMSEELKNATEPIVVETFDAPTSVVWKAITDPAEMCQWLEHPMEFGRPPNEIELIDSRELFWPPTDDRRRLFVFKYRYAPREADEEEDIGHGLVGSVTFALFGEASADLTPLEVYGLHCAWELECNRDPRAPKKRTPLAGLSILRKHNRSLS